MRRKLTNKNIRKIGKKSGSYIVSLPMEMIKRLGWREKQKVEFDLEGEKIIIKDWKK
jgi:antitoxin component of MazEF toxin-antitoxin module